MTKRPWQRRITPQLRSDTFSLVEAAAVAGERCPFSQPRGPIKKGTLIDLGKRGMIATEFFGCNFRVVFILVGENAGRHTALPPNYNGEAPCLRYALKTERHPARSYALHLKGQSLYEAVNARLDRSFLQ
jgi:hypothetical protein